jgi:hypothetical protein
LALVLAVMDVVLHAARCMLCFLICMMRLALVWLCNAVVSCTSGCCSELSEMPALQEAEQLLLRLHRRPAAVCVAFYLLVAVLQVAVAAANFERRMADTAAACGVFDKLLAQDAASMEKASSGSQSESSSSSGSNGVGAIYVLYANFMKQVI